MEAAFQQLEASLEVAFPSVLVQEPAVPASARLLHGPPVGDGFVGNLQDCCSLRGDDGGWLGEEDLVGLLARLGLRRGGLEDGLDLVSLEAEALQGRTPRHLLLVVQEAVADHPQGSPDGFRSLQVDVFPPLGGHFGHPLVLLVHFTHHFLD